MRIHKQHRLTGRNSSGSHTCRAVHFIQNIWNRLSCVNRKSFWYSSPHLKAMYQFGQNYLWILTKIFWSNLARGGAFIHHEHEMKMLFQPQRLARLGVLKSEYLCKSGWNTFVIITGQWVLQGDIQGDDEAGDAQSRCCPLSLSSSHLTMTLHCNTPGEAREVKRIGDKWC